MPAALLASQFAALEEPGAGGACRWSSRIAMPPRYVAPSIVERLGLDGCPEGA